MSDLTKEHIRQLVRGAVESIMSDSGWNHPSMDIRLPADFKLPKDFPIGRIVERGDGWIVKRVKGIKMLNWLLKHKHTRITRKMIGSEKSVFERWVVGGITGFIDQMDMED